jgi:hypothetical protein
MFVAKSGATRVTAKFVLFWQAQDGSQSGWRACVKVKKIRQAKPKSQKREHVHTPFSNTILVSVVSPNRLKPENGGHSGLAGHLFRTYHVNGPVMAQCEKGGQVDQISIFWILPGTHRNRMVIAIVCSPLLRTFSHKKESDSALSGGLDDIFQPAGR